MRYLLVILTILLVGWVDKGGSGKVPGSGGVDKTANEIYNQLMEPILRNKIGFAGSSSNNRKGQVNPYRQGLDKSHKALSACLVWNAATAKVSYKGWYANGSSDWGYAEVFALDSCEKKKLQNSFACKCQTLDHDDVNVLSIPADFRRAYEARAAQTAPKNNIATQKTAPQSVQNSVEQRFFLDVAWEKLLEGRKVYSVMMKQEGRVGYVKSASLIGRKSCDAIFR